MSDMADALIEQGFDSLAMHKAGRCRGEDCEYCWEEAEREEKRQRSTEVSTDE